MVAFFIYRDNPMAGETTEQLFKRQFITSAEICESFKIDRSVLLYARRTGRLPDAMKLGGTFIWAREAVQPYLDAWRISLASQRKELA